MFTWRKEAGAKRPYRFGRGRVFAIAGLMGGARFLLVTGAGFVAGYWKPSIDKGSKGNAHERVETPLLSDETITDILKEFRISNADVLIRDEIDADAFIDCLEGNRKYMHQLVVLNKIDLLEAQALARAQAKAAADLCISARDGERIAELKDLIFDRLDLIRVFLKEPGRQADLEVPLIMFRDASVRDVCDKLHRDFARRFRYCRVWGKSAKFPGQRLMLQHRLADGDVVEVHLR